MIRAPRWMAFITLSAVLMNSIAFAGPTAGVQALQNEVKVLRTKIDSGSAKPAEAIEAFAKALADKEISVSDVNQYVKSRLTAREYEVFRVRMDAALAGVNPADVRTEELAELVGQALSHVRSDGLSWSSCASTVTGAAVIVAAVVAGIIAIVKSKSEETIRRNYAERRAREQGYYDDLADLARNWQTEIPEEIGYYSEQIRRAGDEIRYYEQLYYNTTDPAAQQDYARRIRELNDDIRRYSDEIYYLNNQYLRYMDNPSLAEIDALAYEATRDQVIADLLAQEESAVADVPRNQRLARGLGIGAAVGGAVGAYLLIDGRRDGGCRR